MGPASCERVSWSLTLHIWHCFSPIGYLMAGVIVLKERRREWGDRRKVRERSRHAAVQCGPVTWVRIQLERVLELFSLPYVLVFCYYSCGDAHKTFPKKKLLMCQVWG